MFASVQSGGVEIFLNAPEPAYAEYPAFKDRPIGGTLTLFIEVVDIQTVYDSSKIACRSSCRSSTNGTASPSLRSRIRMGR